MARHQQEVPNILFRDKILATVILSIILPLANADTPDADNTWELKFSDSSRDSRQLNVNLHYGDWVPIHGAKELIENIASKLSDSGAAHAAEPAPALTPADDRLDSGQIQYVQTKPHRHHPRPPHQNRRQDHFGGFQQNPWGQRGQRKLPPPPLGNAINTNNQFRGKPNPTRHQQQPTVQQQQQQFGFVPSFNSFSSFNPFGFFQTGGSSTPSPQQNNRWPQVNPYGQQQPQIPLTTEPSYLESLNAIRTIKAPDLSKVGPPVIELDSKDGEIVVGQSSYPGSAVGEQRDHLAGFVSLDFDGFTSGEPEEKKKPVAKNKSKLSLLVGGRNKLTGSDDIETELVQLLNNGDGQTETFILNSEKDTPSGYSKVDIPFMDPSEHKGELPKVFIAPIDKPIPKGYKGKPLPVKPVSVSNTAEPTTENILFVSDQQDDDQLINPYPAVKVKPFRFPLTESTSTSTEQTTSSTTTRSTSSFRFKLQKERPSLSHFYRKNKKHYDKYDDSKKSEDKQDKSDRYFTKTSLHRKPYDFEIQERDNDNSPSTPSAQTTTVFLPTETTPAPQQYQEEVVTAFGADDVAHVPTTTVVASTTTIDQVEELVEETFDLLPLIQSTLEQVQDQEKTTSEGINTVDEQATTMTYSTGEEVAVTTESNVEQDVEETTTYEAETTAFPYVPTVNDEFIVAQSTESTTTTPEQINLFTLQSVSQSPVTTSTTVNIPVVTTGTTLYTTRRPIRTTLDPFVRLEALRKQKEKEKLFEKPSSSYPVDLITGEDVPQEKLDEAAQPQETVTELPEFRPFRGRLRFRKIIKGAGDESASSGNAFPVRKIKKFGKRIRSRKRPGFWSKYSAAAQAAASGNSNNEEGLLEPTVRPSPFARPRLPGLFGENKNNPVEKSSEDYKKKIRPYFDQIYSEITRDDEEEDETAEDDRKNLRFGLPRKRSTTAAPPITVDAEIYEVHPETRVRITTRRPLTSTEEYLAYSDEYDTEVTEDYVSSISTTTTDAPESLRDEFEPSTTERNVFRNLYTKRFNSFLQTTTSASTEQASTEVPTTTVVSESTKLSASTEAVHETADKHSTFLPIVTHEDNEQHQVVEDLEDAEVDLNIANEIGDQVYEESQNVPTAWQETTVTIEEATTVSTSSDRLTSYEKNINTSHYGVDKEFDESQSYEPVVNEHGQQQQLAINADDAVVSDAEDNQADEIVSESGWQPLSKTRSYVELDRSARPTASIEAVEITETKDYSEPEIIYDVDKEGFEDDAETDVYSVPVSVKINLPESVPTTVSTVPEVTTEGEVATDDVTDVAQEETTMVSETVAASTTTGAPSEVPTTTTNAAPVPVSTTNPTTEVQESTVTEKQTREQFEEIFLGTARPKDYVQPTPNTEYVVINIGQADPTNHPLVSPHKIPTNLWTAFEISRGQESSAEAVDTISEPSSTTLNLGELTVPTTVPEEEINTEGLNYAGLMSHVMHYDAHEDSSKEGSKIILIDDLPKPSEHESEIVLIEEAADNDEEDIFNNERKLPKSFDFHAARSQIVNDKEDKEEESIANKKNDSGAKKREEWIKNWVARKFNKPKFPRGPISSLVSSATSQTETTTSTSVASSNNDSVNDSVFVTNSSSVRPGFAPTVPPAGGSQPGDQQLNKGRFSVNFDVTVRDGSEEKAAVGNNNEYKTSLLEKFTRNKLKNSLFNKENILHRGKPSAESPSLSSPSQLSVASIFSASAPTPSPFHVAGGVPLGAKTDVYKKYGTDKLSQADFERKILGVSAETEVSVQSMICARGRCYNADDIGRRLS